MSKPDELIEVLLDPAAKIADRDNAAMDLGRYDDPATLDALVKIASDGANPEFLRRAAGASIGHVWFRSGVRDVETYTSMTSEARRECIAVLFAEMER